MSRHSTDQDLDMTPITLPNAAASAHAGTRFSRMTSSVNRSASQAIHPSPSLPAVLPPGSAHAQYTLGRAISAARTDAQGSHHHYETRSKGPASRPEGYQAPPRGTKRKAGEYATASASKKKAVEVSNSAQTHTLALTGMGPRGFEHFNADYSFVKAHEPDFALLQAAGAVYHVVTIGIERNDESYVARGRAFGVNQGGGTVDTGAERSKAQRFEAFINGNRERLLDDYIRQGNPVAAALLQSAFQGGHKLTTAQPFAP